LADDARSRLLQRTLPAAFITPVTNASASLSEPEINHFVMAVTPLTWDA
jgi:hypothetical protein